jgi:hypothetical protein
MPKVTEHIKIDDESINKNDVYTIMDPVYWNITIYDGEQKYLESLIPFSKEQRLLIAIRWYLEEVNNGGHEQFYSNSAGIVWRDAIIGFKELGIDGVVKIIEESVMRLGGNPSLDRESRNEELKRYNCKFDDLDDQFYKLEGCIDIDEIMKNYILKHRSAFYFDGEVNKWKPQE